jgi:tetratricopeptide (TPR) repeat protein
MPFPDANRPTVPDPTDAAGQPATSAAATLPPATEPATEPATGGDGATLPPQEATRDSATLPPAPDGSTLAYAPAQHPGETLSWAGAATFLPAIPGYEVLGELGRGGMGVVFKARDTRLKRLVALKMIRGTPDPRDLARFRAEAEAVARLQHPNVIQIHEIGDHNGQPYFSLEFVEGGSLDRSIQGTPQPPRESAALIRTLALAMQVAHDAGIVHRDLKPANVLMAGDREKPWWEGVAKVGDFGLAKRLDDDSGQTRHGAPMGTPSYMAPEQASGDIEAIGPWSDVWALGAILYELITGRPPFKGQTVWDTLAQVGGQDPVAPTRLNNRCPRDLEVIILKCLQKRPKDRYESARGLADDLQSWLDGRPIQARPAGRIERTVKWARRSPFQAAALAAAAACIVAVGLALYAQTRSAQAAADIAHRELVEQKRLDSVRDRFHELYSRAENGAAAAATVPDDRAAWVAVEGDARSVLDMVRDEPSLADNPLLEPARRLQAQAEGRIAHARDRDAARGRLPQFHKSYAEAVFHGTLYTGLDLTENIDRARKAAAEGLTLFGVTPDNDGAPQVDPRFFSPAEAQAVAADCYELLLIDSQALAQPHVGEPAGAWRGRLRQALARVDRADHLGVATKTHSGLTLRAQYLDALGKAGDLAEREQAAKAASEALAEADHVAPSLAADFFLVGLSLHRQDQFEQALKPLDNALLKQPNHFGARYLRAVCLNRLKRHAQARDALTECLRQQPDFFWPHLLRGYAEMELRDFPASQADFDAVLQSQLDPAVHYVALVDRGVLRMKQARWDDAQADFREAIKMRPEWTAAYINLALTQRQRGEDLARSAAPVIGPAPSALARAAWSDGVAALDEAVRRRPEAADVYRERGRLHLLLGHGAPAREDFFQAVARSSNAGAAAERAAGDLIEVGRLLHYEKDFAGALRAYNAVLTLPNERTAPQQVLANRLKAEPLLALHRYNEAGDALDAYLKTVPATEGKAPPPDEADRLAKAFLARGLIHVEQGDFRLALDSYTRGLHALRSPELLGARGWAYLMFQAPHLALPDFDEALTHLPADASDKAPRTDVLLGRADALIKLDRVPEALDAATAAMQAGGDVKPRVYYNAARVYAQASAKLDGAADRAREAVMYQNRAVALLRQAVEQTPTAEREDFWKRYVGADASLALLRNRADMTELAAHYAPAPR